MRTVAFSEVNPQLLAQLSQPEAEPVQASDAISKVILMPEAQYLGLRQVARDHLMEVWEELSTTAQANGLTEEILKEILAEIDAETPC